MSEARFSISQLNSLPAADFVRVIGPVFEQSPWIAENVAPLRPFLGFDSLRDALCDAMWSAPADRQMTLIRSHPDLAGRLARQGQLTVESTREQASAGLGRLSPDELARFQELNDAYRSKFGFPFIICARLNNKDAILGGFQHRLQNSREAEIQAALTEITKIAELRLKDILAP